jgi:hypothetical protein
MRGKSEWFVACCALDQVEESHPAVRVVRFDLVEAWSEARCVIEQPLLNFTLGWNFIPTFECCPLRLRVVAP